MLIFLFVLLNPHSKKIIKIKDPLRSRFSLVRKCGHLHLPNFKRAFYLNTSAQQRGKTTHPSQLLKKEAIIHNTLVKYTEVRCFTLG